MDSDVLFLDAILDQAQVMVIVNERWFVYAPMPYRCQGKGELPKVNCPVVDCSGIAEDLFPKMAQVVGDCVDVQHGVLNRGGLLTGLEALGGVVAPGEEARGYAPLRGARVME